jgi:fatty-acyl-CoA synthase
MQTAAAPKDNSASRAWLRALERTAPIDRAPERIFPLVIEELGERFGDAPALIGVGEGFSHAALAAEANRYANWALAQGVAKGDRVALLLPNRPAYIAAWLGITRIGGVAALINTHLTGPALAHCLSLAAPRHILVDPSLSAGLEKIAVTAKIWTHDQAFARGLAGFSGAPTAAAGVTLSDPALLIYTSGTTGLPKAAFVSHHRIMTWTHWFAGLMDARADDRLYDCLPMYHSMGGVAAPGAVLLAGGAVIVREKFSAHAFWDDVAESGATIFQYIGELCRYLLNSPARPTAHQLRLACGNGLSGEVWTDFEDRFAIPQILEFYAATEGNFSLYNVEGKKGSIGRIPAFLKHRAGVALIALDAEGEPLRGADGFCRPAETGRPGEAIGRIAGGAARFEGYSDPAATEKKILRHVFAPGDAWLRTGDLMRRDTQGFFYFVDRLGDTFRWKGENVSTAEVAAALGACPGVAAATVYGVRVPGAEGRAGMAALEVDTGFDPARLSEHLATRLPGYAQPLFLRLVSVLALTETFKPKKQALMEDGFDPGRIADPLLMRLDGCYVPLDAALYARISSGRMRF